MNYRYDSASHLTKELFQKCVCPSVVVEKIPHLFVSKISKHFQGVLQKDKYGGDIPSLSHLSSSDNADNTVCHTLFAADYVFPNKGFNLIYLFKMAHNALLIFFCHESSLQKYFPRSQIEMSFISLVNIWDNVSGSTPLPPHKTYKCLRNFPAGLYTHARWHLFKTTFCKN